MEALREALLNAIVHRDYSISSSTLISIFDDRIAIVTIGGLVRGVSFEDIMLGVSVLRNQHLANVFYRLKLIEAYGTGMLKNGFFPLGKPAEMLVGGVAPKPLETPPLGAAARPADAENMARENKNTMQR